MSKFQLWSQDEYGQGSIIMTSEDIDEVIKRGKQEVTSLNVQNALTSTDRENNWEAYFVNVKTASKKSKTKYAYCGRDIHTLDRVYAVTEKDVKDIVLSEVPKAEVEIYLGNISVDRKVEKDWITADLRARPFSNLDNPELKSKMMFFVKRVK
jgi:hypothetical protein